ncbi:MAG: c-type cytochrome [Chloroflexota bacterium]
MKPAFQSKKSPKELYKEKYEASKVGGESFFPDTIAKDAIVALLLVTVVITLALVFPAETQPPADPASTTYNPRPEWYFLFFFQFLKLFPGYLEPVAAAIIPMLALLVLVLVPFLDRSKERRWSTRKPVTAMGVAVVLIIAALGVGGTLSAPARPAGEESLVVQSGREVYREINCGYCHSINGVGGNIGPDLSNVGGEMNPAQLAEYLRNPHAMVPSTLHPKLQFTEEEMKALIAYLDTLGAPVSYTAQAPVLYEQNCSSCHIINGKGGALGPDLSRVGTIRSVGFLESFISNPASVLPGTTMPAYKDKLTTAEIKDIAAYLANQRGGEAPTPVPSPTPAPSPAPVPSPAGPPAIPHSLEGRDNCLSCHGPNGIVPFPANHAGRTNDTCRACHQPG